MVSILDKLPFHIPVDSSYLGEYCQSPGPLLNGGLAPVREFYANGVKLRTWCSDGWTLDGDEILECKNGQWSKILPKCQSKSFTKWIYME